MPSGQPAGFSSEVLVGRSMVLEKAMTAHSSVLAWRIPGVAEPGGLPSMGSHRVGHDRSDLTAAAWCSGKSRGWSPKDLSSLSLSVIYL